jgi:uncharacterized protein
MNVRQETVVPPASLMPASTAMRAEAVRVRDRVEAIDVIRGIALFGVLLVNLTTEFRVSIFEQFLGKASPGSSIDSLIEHLVLVCLESKAFVLFSILFGVGLAIQFERLTMRGRPFYWLVRRLLVLLAFGLAHLLLIWNGDILTEYAVVGLLALPFLHLRPRDLVTAAFMFLLIFIVQSSMPWSMQWPSTGMLKQHVAFADTIYSTGSYADIVQFGYRELLFLLPLHLYVLPRTMALFLFGMFFWRVGIFNHQVQFKHSIRIAAAVGVMGATTILATDGGGWPGSLPLLREWSMNVAPIMLALGYGATILVLMGLPVVSKVLGIFAPLGRMAFTNYLIQSLVCGFVFFGYGLGHFGHLAVAPAFALGVAIYLVQMILSSYWLSYYRFGPMEWLWRSLMYGKMQPMSNKRF